MVAGSVGQVAAPLKRGLKDRYRYGGKGLTDLSVAIRQSSRQARFYPPGKYIA